MPRSNCAREPQLLSLRVWSLCSATREAAIVRDRKSTRLNSSHTVISYAVFCLKKKSKISEKRASLVAQWLRICLLMQGTRVRALVWEDPTCHGAAGPVSHNC